MGFANTAGYYYANACCFANASDVPTSLDFFQCFDGFSNALPFYTALQVFPEIDLLKMFALVIQSVCVNAFGFEDGGEGELVGQFSG